MAIKGKKQYMVYLTEKDAELIKQHLDTKKGRGGFSEFLDKYVERSATLLRKNWQHFAEIEPGKLTFKKMWKLAKLDYSK